MRLAACSPHPLTTTNERCHCKERRRSDEAISFGWQILTSMSLVGGTACPDSVAYRGRSNLYDTKLLLFLKCCDKIIVFSMSQSGNPAKYL